MSVDLERRSTTEQRHLGYPAYFAVILGTWKLLGALVIAAPGLPRLKEWAYAGFVFDLTAAAYSRAAVGDSAADVIAPLVFLALVLASWRLRPASRKLDAAANAEGGEVTSFREPGSSRRKTVAPLGELPLARRSY